MARKNLLEGLMNEAGKDAAPPAKTPEKRPYKGAIGAVSQSIEALKARSLIDLDPHLIEAGGLQDRLEDIDADDAALRASLREYGQQVPIMVRPHPDKAGRYQIVYGRRRVLAARDLGIEVKALVRDLDERALIMAQGQENNARRGLSFIEKANFAAQMREAGYDRKAMCDALAIDKTVISRMLSIYDRVGPDIVGVCGAAAQIGRDRWLQLATMIEDYDLDTQSLAEVAVIKVPEGDGSQRFDAILDWAHRHNPTAGEAPPPAARPPAAPKGTRTTIKSAGAVLARVASKPDAVTLTVPTAGTGGFGTWLADNLEEIHRTWLNQRRGDE